MQRSVVLEEGQSKEMLVVETEDDELAETDGRITATIGTGSGYRVGSQNTAHVTVSDAKDRQDRKTRVSGALQAMLPNLLAESTTRSLWISSERTKQAIHGDTSTSIELNGQSQISGVLESGGEMLNGDDTDWRSFIDDSSFTVTLYPEGGESSSATVWGYVDRRNLKGNGIGIQQSWQGENHTGHFGFDTTVGQGVLAGLAFSVSNAEIGYGNSGNSKITIEALSTGIHPFMGFSSDDGSARIQVMAGFGGNELELIQEKYSPETLSGNFHTFGFSGSNRIYFNGSLGTGHSSELSLAGEAWHAQQSVSSATGLIDSLQASAHHFRIALDGSQNFGLEGGGTVSPSISIGLRGDGRNEEFASGMDVDSGIRYESFNGLAVEGAGMTLLSNLNRVLSWEFRSRLDYDSASDGKGILFTMSPSWGGAETDTDTERYIWGSELSGVSNTSFDFPDGIRLASEIGYGFEILDGTAVLTPFHSFEQAGTHDKEFRIGSRISTNAGVYFELGAVRDVPETGKVGHEFKMNGSINW